MKRPLNIYRDLLFVLLIVLLGLAIIGVYNYLRMAPVMISEHAPMEEDMSGAMAMPQIKALQRMKKSKPIRVLSVDGGGVRGLIPARVLLELERKTGKPTAELFDLLIGSSSGAITVMTLTVPDEKGQPLHNAQDVIDLYNDNAKKIFYAPWIHKVMSLDGLIAPKFLAESKHAVFEATAGDLKFSELIRPVMVPALDYFAVSPVLFRNWVHDRDYFVADILSGATSPPTIFPPIEIYSLDHTEKHMLVDGAMFLDSPAIEAWVQASKMFPDREFIVVSLGTGYIGPNTFNKDSLDWGLLQWSSELIGLILSSHIRFVDHRMADLVMEEGFDLTHYYRFNMPLDTTEADAFSGDPDNLTMVADYAETLVNDNQDKLDELARRLTRQ